MKISFTTIVLIKEIIPTPIHESTNYEGFSRKGNSNVVKNVLGNFKEFGFINSKFKTCLF